MRRSPTSFAHRHVQCVFCSALTLTFPAELWFGGQTPDRYALWLSAFVTMFFGGHLLGRESFVLRLMSFARDAFVAWCNRTRDKK